MGVSLSARIFYLGTYSNDYSRIMLSLNSSSGTHLFCAREVVLLLPAFANWSLHMRILMSWTLLQLEAWHCILQLLSRAKMAPCHAVAQSGIFQKRRVQLVGGFTPSRIRCTRTGLTSSPLYFSFTLALLPALSVHFSVRFHSPWS